MAIKIVTLIENKAGENICLYNEHGLSLFIEVDDMKILFDTGKSGDFIKNAISLNIDLDDLDYVLLSHGHYDHSGGFEELINKSNGSFKLLLGKGFFNEKYKAIDNGYKYNGNSFKEEFLNENHISKEYIDTDLYYITDNIIVFSNFKAYNNFENINSNFKIKIDNNYIDDLFLDEIALGIKTPKGLIVIVGCSHIGIVNILNSIIASTKLPIYAVIGGTHLIEASEDRLDITIQHLKDLNVEILAVSHCTGEEGINKLKDIFKEKFIYNNTGNILNLI